MTPNHIYRFIFFIKNVVKKLRIEKFSDKKTQNIFLSLHINIEDFISFEGPLGYLHQKSIIIDLLLNK